MGVRSRLRQLRRDKHTDLSAEDLSLVDDSEQSTTPTYTRISVEGVTIDFYLAVRSGDSSFEFMPRGLQVHIAFEDEAGMRILSCWDELRHGREFFRSQLAGNVQSAVLEGNQRGDFVREEMPLAGLELGVGAGAFEQSHFHTIPSAEVFVTHVGGMGAAQQQAVPWDDVRDAIGDDASLGGALAARMTAIDAGGLEIAEVWTDAQAGGAFHSTILPHAVASALGPDAKPNIDTRSYPVSYCMISAETLADFGVTGEPGASAPRPRRYVQSRRRRRLRRSD